MYFKPNPGAVGDIIPYEHDSEVHLFYLLTPEENAERMHTSWAHIKSKDLLHWKKLPVAVKPGKEGDPDKSGCWTGSIVEHNGLFHMFYTGVNFEKEARWQTICHATSENLIEWNKDSNNPVLSPDEEYYELNDWRDPFVYWNDQEQCFFMLITARNNEGWPQRRGCIGLAKSKDLKAWEVHPPFWDPNLAHTIECPEIFTLGFKRYLTYSTYSEKRVSHYRLIKSDGTITYPNGPDQLESSFYYAIKSIAKDNHRVMFGWIPERLGKIDEGRILFGGNLGIPHILSMNEDDKINVNYPDSLRAIIGNRIECKKTKSTSGWQNSGRSITGSSLGGVTYFLLKPQPKSFYLKTKIEIEQDHTKAGLLLNADEDLKNSYLLEIEKISKKINLKTYPTQKFGINSRPNDDLLQSFVIAQQSLMKSSRQYVVELFYSKGKLTAFVNGSTAMSARMYNTGKHFGFYVETGEASFISNEMHKLKMDEVELGNDI